MLDSSSVTSDSRNLGSLFSLCHSTSPRSRFPLPSVCGDPQRVDKGSTRRVGRPHRASEYESRREVIQKSMGVPSLLKEKGNHWGLRSGCEPYLIRVLSTDTCHYRSLDRSQEIPKGLPISRSISKRVVYQIVDRRWTF